MSDVRTLHLTHLSRPLAFVDSRAVADTLRGLLRGWGVRDGAPGEADSAAIRVILGDDGYRLECAWLPRSRRFGHEVDAACAVVAELSQALLEEDRRLLCLHSGAVEVGGRLVVLPSHYGAGKSVFAACCAAAGHRIFADDVLPLVCESGGDPDLDPVDEPGGDDSGCDSGCDSGGDSGGDRGRALGFAPRLRLPLPDDLGERTRAFVEAHRGPESARYRYLDLDDGRLAAFGDRAEIGAFVLLERVAGSEPRLTDVGAGEMLRHVVLRNFARDLPASAILERLYRLVARSRRLRLTYGAAEPAVRRLIDALGAAWGAAGGAAGPGDDAPLRPAMDLAAPPDPTTAAPTAAPGAAPAAPPGCYLRHPGVAAMEVEGETFLTDPEDRSIHHLNAMAAALWRLFAEPVSTAEALSVLRAAFPDLPERQCEADFERLTRRLVRNGLLLSPGDAPP